MNTRLQNALKSIWTTVLVLSYIITMVYILEACYEKKIGILFTIITTVLLLLTVIATFLSKEDKFKNTVAGVGIIVSVFTLYATNSYNISVQKQNQYEEIRKQAQEDGAWISDTSNVPVVSFTNKNSSNLPLYNAYFFLVKKNDLRSLDSSRIRFYRTIAPGTTKGSFIYSKVNEKNKFDWEIAYVFEDTNNRYWYRNINGRLIYLTSREYEEKLRNAGIKKNRAYDGTNHPNKF